METSSLAVLALGFALGLRHSTDADHIAAVSTLVSDTADVRRGMRIGVFWGLGHLLAVLALGGALVALRVELSPRVEWALELMVAAVLIALGVRAIRKCFTARVHLHAHRHGPHRHAHLHFHPRDESIEEHDSHAFAAARPLLLGLAHGLAGTAGLALLVLGAIPSRALGILYLIVFGAGALAGMVGLSALVGLPFARTARRGAWLGALRLAAGTASAALGAVLTYRSFLPSAWPF